MMHEASSRTAISDCIVVCPQCSSLLARMPAASSHCYESCAESFDEDEVWFVRYKAVDLITKGATQCERSNNHATMFQAK